MENESYSVRSTLRKMEVGGYLFISPRKCKYSTIKTTATQLKKMGEGEWKVTRKLVAGGRIKWIESTKVIRVK